MEINYINKYIEELKLKSDNNFINLNKIISQSKKYENDIKKLKTLQKKIIDKKKLYKNYILSIIISTFSISEIVFLLNYVPNILFYLLISFTASTYYYSNKYVKLKYHNKYLDEINNELINLENKYKINKNEEQKIILISKKINNRIKILEKIKNNINTYLTGIDEKEKNKFIFLNYESEKKVKKFF